MTSTRSVRSHHAAAIAIGPLIGFIAQKLIDQIAIGPMQFDAVESGRLGIGGAAAELLDDVFDFSQFPERAG